MAKPTKKQLRAAWLQVHKWIGLSLAHPDHSDLADRRGPGLARLAGSEARAAAPSGDWPAGLPPSAYAAAANAVLSGDDRIASIRFDGHGGPVMVTASKPAQRRRRPAGADQRLARPTRRARDRQGVGQQRAGAGHARPPRQPDGAWLGPHDRRLGRRLHAGLVAQRHVAVVAAERLLRQRLPAGSGATRSMPTSIISPASGSCCRWPCCPSPAPGFPSPRSSARSNRVQRRASRTAHGPCARGPLAETADQAR